MYVYIYIYNIYIYVYIYIYIHTYIHNMYTHAQAATEMLNVLTEWTVFALD